MTIRFRKMHGLGNDFVVIDAREQPIQLKAEAIAAIADRRTGVGCDQLMVLEPARDAGTDAHLRMFNADGGEVGACGNGSRCVAGLLMAETGRPETRFGTMAGILAGYMEGGAIAVDMGPTDLSWDRIPLSHDMETLSVPVGIGPLARGTAVSMGNPHIVFFVEAAAAIDLSTLGPVVEHHPLFPERTNVEVVEVLGPDHLRMRVWERGVGITRACGTGACATTVAAVLTGRTGRHVRVEADGGPLTVTWREADGHVILAGPIATSFSGVLDPSLLQATPARGAEVAA